MEMEDGNRRVHVVILPISAQGHLIPALFLAHKLATAGFHVTYVVYGHRLEQMKKQAVARGCHEGINMISLKLNDPPPEILEKCTSGHDSYELLDWVFEHMDDARDEFLQILLGFKSLGGCPGAAACIITDGMGWTQDVADELGIPRIVIYPGPVENLVVDFYVKTLHAQGRIPIRCSLRQENGVTAAELEPLQIPGLAPIHPDDLNSLLLDATDKFIVDCVVESVLRNHEAGGILGNSFMEMESPACAAMRSREINPNAVPFLPVGPLLADSYFEEEEEDAARCRVKKNKEECLEWLDEQPAGSVVYVSFGSIAMVSAEQSRELALGLEASGHRFLWVLRAEQSAYEASPFEILPKGFLARTQGRGFVMERFAPQLLILSHPATGGFLTHSGWNSTLESICLGVPMLSMPFFSDQRLICRMVVDRLRIAMDIPSDANGLVHKEAFEHAVKSLMGSEKGEAVRAKVKELQAAARRAHKATDDNLKAFMMQQIKCPQRNI